MPKRCDFHIHSVYSDGELIPAEIARRCEELGCDAIAITDHVDNTNLDFVLGSLVNSLAELSENMEIEVFPGIELTHVPPAMLEKLVKRARKLGAAVVVVHGETLVEPVAKGTNLTAVKLPEVDILAHPGLLTLEEAELAKENEIFLELSTRQGHCLANGHVARVAKEAKAKLVLNTDAHSPSDLVTYSEAIEVALGAGLSEKDSKIVTAVTPRDIIRDI